MIECRWLLQILVIYETLKGLTDEASITLMDPAFNYPNISVLQGENRNFPIKTKVPPFTQKLIFHLQKCQSQLQSQTKWKNSSRQCKHFQISKVQSSTKQSVFIETLQNTEHFHHHNHNGTILNCIVMKVAFTAHVPHMNINFFIFSN